MLVLQTSQVDRSRAATKCAAIGAGPLGPQWHRQLSPVSQVVAAPRRVWPRRAWALFLAFLCPGPSALKKTQFGALKTDP